MRMRMRSHVRTMESTSLPLPLPRDAPAMTPGTSRICILAWLYSRMPGMTVSVVNA